MTTNAPISPDVTRHGVEARCVYPGGETTMHWLDRPFDWGWHAEIVADEHLAACNQCQAKLAKNVAEQEVHS